MYAAPGVTRPIQKQKSPSVVVLWHVLDCCVIFILAPKSDDCFEVN